MSNEANKPVIFLAFANDRDDRARYLRNLAEEARQVRTVLAAGRAARPLRAGAAPERHGRRHPGRVPGCPLP